MPSISKPNPSTRNERSVTANIPFRPLSPKATTARMPISLCDKGSYKPKPPPATQHQTPSNVPLAACFPQFRRTHTPRMDQRQVQSEDIR